MSMIEKNGFDAYFSYGRTQINYLVNCSSKYKYVYIETPKVGCSTIKRVLQMIEVGSDSDKLPINVHDRKNSPLVTLYDLKKDPYEIFDSDMFFVFAFVRNPYSRIVSAYLDKIVQNEWERKRLLPSLGLSEDANISLREFLEIIRDVPDIDKDIHWTPQSYLLQWDKINYDFVGRFENFQNSLARVIKKINPYAGDGLLSVRDDRHRTDASKKVLEYVGEREANLIIEIYEDDFRNFNYSFDPHFGSV